MILLDIIQLIIYAYLAFGVVYIFIFGFAGMFKQRVKPAAEDIQRKIAVLIPGYKEDAVIVEVAQDALNQDYPSDIYDVVIIADSFQEDTLTALKQLPIKVIEVSFESSTKAKALNKAMAELPDNYYDIAVVLDADNVMEANFLTKINNAFNHGFMAVQGHRVAKNMNTSFAILDAVSEEINNNIFRKGHRILRLSAAIIGSGMAIEYKYFKDMMLTIHAVGGFDKEIELRMLKERKTIEYDSNAYVYDEKVQKAEVFQNQRRRWIAAQIHYFSKDFLTSLAHLFRYGNIDYFDKALQFILPPRILLLGFLFIFLFLSILLNPLEYTIAWFVLLLMCILAFLFSIPSKFYSHKTLVAIGTIPRGFILMFLSLIRLKGANKKFIHTEHTSTKNSN